MRVGQRPFYGDLLEHEFQLRLPRLSRPGCAGVSHSLHFAVGLETNTLPTPCAQSITTTAMASGPPSIHGTDSMLRSCTSAQRAACYATERGSISAASSSRTEFGSTWHMLASTATVSDNLPPDPDRPSNPNFEHPLVFMDSQLAQEPQQSRGSTITT